jgi:hypothetical protein
MLLKLHCIEKSLKSKYIINLCSYDKLYLSKLQAVETTNHLCDYISFVFKNFSLFTFSELPFVCLLLYHTKCTFQLQTHQIKILQYWLQCRNVQSCSSIQNGTAIYSLLQTICLRQKVLLWFWIIIWISKFWIVKKWLHIYQENNIQLDTFLQVFYYSVNHFTFRFALSHYTQCCFVMLAC